MPTCLGEHCRRGNKLYLRVDKLNGSMAQTVDWCWSVSIEVRFLEDAYTLNLSKIKFPSPKIYASHHRQIWQAFVQESICSIAAASEINLELQDNLAIDDVTKQAFSILGEKGLIHAADQHKCQECTQHYKKTADIITGDDPAAFVGIDENWNVPALVRENADLAAEAAEQARANALHAASKTDQEMVDNNSNGSYVTMAVVDGIVISSQTR